MKIAVSEIPEEGLEVEMEEALSSDSVRVVPPARVSLKIRKVGAEVVVSGAIRAAQVMTCSRCLKDFTQELDVPVDLVYEPAEDLGPGEKHELKADELETGFYSGDELDIEGMVEEQMLLSVPLKPLCKETCLGLCPRCGADLNEGPCGCAAKTDSISETLKEPTRRKANG